ncbi:MAG: pyrroline-5-carboxylate reductase [Candidatus Omnitrophica bacterium]|nr:pyrroline-5-carboxylate reductase [Candidatus Omnitrophota bacterium]
MIGIIGAGNMGSAIALRMDQKILISDAAKARLRALKRRRRILTSASNIDVARRSNVIIIAVKPQRIAGVLNEIKPHVKRKLVISIAAGVGTKLIEKILKSSRVIRVMPNMPLVAGKGMSAIATGSTAGKKDLAAARRIFSRFGEVIAVKESSMDAVTAVSGSGPAYYFLFTGLLEKAACACGLKKDIARQLAKATFIGAAACASATNTSMQDFVKKVASKGGTTEAALKVFKQRGLGRIIKQAVKAATTRSRKLK